MAGITVFLGGVFLPTSLPRTRKHPEGIKRDKARTKRSKSKSKSKSHRPPRHALPPASHSSISTPVQPPRITNHRATLGRQSEMNSTITPVIPTAMTSRIDHHLQCTRQFRLALRFSPTKTWQFQRDWTCWRKYHHRLPHPLTLTGIERCNAVMSARTSIRIREG
jgi:hypothetical protein